MNTYTDKKFRQNSLAGWAYMIVMTVLSGLIAWKVFFWKWGETDPFGQTVIILGAVVCTGWLVYLTHKLYEHWPEKIISFLVVELPHRRKFKSYFGMAAKNATFNEASAELAKKLVYQELFRLAMDSSIAFQNLHKLEKAAPDSMSDKGVEALKKRIKNQKQRATDLQARVWEAYDVANWHNLAPYLTERRISVLVEETMLVWSAST